ncbi:molybdate ABC transporter substrate-binding protein [Alkaliphilus sp. MSJ-5]|uniref:Molybdate ABC transporter substrate-binding protein n=1 Tax=Alkaliphilus flagellatus TaxID=2841507 RepID=A0ABS6G5S8_9FIRM|nr:molybdate ABC transporter substrate-binding protein [Alkaliphilus flagellatus]MBU5676770.1 molybdate ABC transporter substrate-binding protein [Alkaliphilus flagellatus]
MTKKIVLLLLICSLVLAGCTNKPKATEGEVPEVNEEITLNVFAAASLTDAFNEMKDIYEKENDGITLQFNFAGSGTLQKQIEEGATADYFISAGASQMNALEEKGLIEDRKDLLKNKLVVVGTKDMEGKVSKIEDLLSEDVKYIAVGTPETVPVGKYTEEALTHYDLWEKLSDKIVFTKDVRQALTYVDTGNSDVGFVYSSDALALENGVTLFEVSDDSHKKIIYPAAIIKETEYKDAAAKFAEFLVSKEGSAILEKHGFVLN